jgi:ABC-type nitrate/sulfonate/bicarbonate transport system permease component
MGVAVCLLLWEASVHLLRVGSSAFPAPSRILLEIWRDGSQLSHHAMITALETIAGLVLGLLASGLLAGWAMRTGYAANSARSILSFLARMPVFAFAPLLVVWVGFGFPSAMALCFLVSLQPFLSRLLMGIEGIPGEIVAMLQAMGASRWSIRKKVYLPACLPAMTRGLRSAIPSAFAGAAVAEFVGSDAGLGYLMFSAGAKADSTELFAALMVLLLMSVGSHAFVSFAERRWILGTDDSP